MNSGIYFLPPEICPGLHRPPANIKKNHPLPNGCRVKMKMKNSTKCDTTLPDCWLRKYCFWTPWLDDFLFSFFFYFARELLWPRWVESIIKMNAMTEIGNDDGCVLLLSGEHVRH